MKTLIAMTVVGFGIIGLVIWVYFASYADEGRSNITKCTSEPSRQEVSPAPTTTRPALCKKPDGSLWLVDMNGQLSEIQLPRG